MHRLGLSIVSAALAFGGSHCAEAAQCYNIAKGEPASLSGVLDYGIFAGPPNFKSVKLGDAPEPNYVLILAKPICISGDEFADPRKPFRFVQVAETRETNGQLAQFNHKKVTLALTQQTAAETPHHHEPLVAWVTSVHLQDARPKGR